MVSHPSALLFRILRVAESSRAPSYFSKFFEAQLRQNEDTAGGVRTLYIDRDPSTFQDIARHLQGLTYSSACLGYVTHWFAGYHIQPRDGQHYVRLFADAQFYGCKSTTRK